MRILPQFDTGTIQEVLHSDFPELPIDSIRLIENGWDNIVVEVNTDWIFRFPKDAEFHFDVEQQLLTLFGKIVSLKIPKVEYVGKSYTYMGYRKIPGGDLTRELFDSMTTGERDQLIFDLANFLREIHSAISPSEARALGVEDEDLPSYATLVRSVLPQQIDDRTVKEFVDFVLQEYEQMIPASTEQVVLYNDLHTENMAFDAQAKVLRGVFDFGDVLIGDVNMDFYPLYKFDPYVMKAVAQRYEELTQRTLNMRRMAVYAWISELADLAQYIDQPDSAVYINAVNRIHRWNAERAIFIE